MIAWIQQLDWSTKDESVAPIFKPLLPTRLSRDDDPDSTLENIEASFDNNAIKYDQICAYQNGAALQYRVYSLSGADNQKAVAYVLQECIGAGPMAGRCHTFIDIYNPPHHMSAEHCSAFVQQIAGKVFRYFTPVNN